METDPDLQEKIDALKATIATGGSGDEEVETARLEAAGDIALDLVAEMLMSQRRQADAMERIADVLEKRHGAG